MARSLAFNSLPDVIPVFPLESAVVLPRARLPLNIFEPRYLAMLDDTLKTEHRLIGMSQPREEGPNPAVYEIGCAGRVTSFSETDDGRYLIALTGALRYRVIEEVDGFTPYRRMRVAWTEFRGDLSSHTGFEFTDEQRGSFLSLLKRYFEAAGLSADWESLSRADEETLINAIAMLCPFSPEEKQALIEAPTLRERHENLQTLIEFVVAAPTGSSDIQ